jgi:hypothetical protein
MAGYLQGDFHDVTFAFVRARLMRCDNGTDMEGKPLPGMCHMPEEINRLPAPRHNPPLCMCMRMRALSERFRCGISGAHPIPHIPLF